MSTLLNNLEIFRSRSLDYGSSAYATKIFDRFEVVYRFLLLLQLNDTLPKIFQNLQILAAGLELMVQGQNPEDGDTFSQQYNETYHNLLLVLTEVQVAIVELGLKTLDNIRRSHIPDEFRDVADNMTKRNLRDFIIYRDYMNGLEYVIQVIEYFSSKEEQ